MKNTTGTCKQCGEEFLRKSKVHVFCSINCSHDYFLFRSRTSIAAFRVFKRDDFKCIYCGKSSIEDGVKLNLDHVVPCGANRDFEDLNNLATSCHECNHSKYNFHLPDDILVRIQEELIKRNKKLDVPMNIKIK